MIKGWRNDPQWVAYFEKKQEAKIQRQIDRIKRRNQAALDMARASALFSNQRMNHGFVEAGY